MAGASNRTRNHVAETMARLIVILLTSRWSSARSAARRLGVCERTLMRYLDALERAGFAVPRTHRLERA